MRFWPAISVLTLVVVVLAVGCIVDEKEYYEQKLRSARRPNFPPVELNPIGFDKHWEYHIRDREIMNVWLLDYNIYAETKGHWLYKIEGTKGTVDWVYDIGASIEARPYIYNYSDSDKQTLKKFDEIFILAADAIHCVDEEEGFKVWSHGLRFTPSSQPFASASHFYYGSWDDRLRAVNKQTKVITWEHVTRGDIVAGGAQDDPSIYFVSEDNTIYCADASRGTITWKYTGYGPFSATPYFYKNRLYVGCRDFYLYSIRTSDGTLDWRFPCEAEIVSEPVAVDYGTDNRSKMVYCRAKNNWFFAVDRWDGKEKWRLRDGVKLLLAGRKNAYVLTGTKEIACVENQTGEVQWKKPFKDVDFFATNDADWRTIKKGDSDYLIYFGYRNAWFFCIREKDLY